MLFATGLRLNNGNTTRKRNLIPLFISKIMKLGDRLSAGRLLEPSYVRDIQIISRKGVFPIFMRSTRLLVTILKSANLNGKKILDLGTGTGILAIFCKKNSNSEVYASDISKKAVQTAKMNAQLNEVQIEVRHGDLFTPFEGKKFDLIIFNPPFFPLVPKDKKERTIFAGRKYRVIQRFVKELPQFLENSGYALLSCSSLSLPPLSKYLSHQSLKKDELGRVIAAPGEEIIAYCIYPSL